MCFEKAHLACRSVIRRAMMGDAGRLTRFMTRSGAVTIAVMAVIVLLGTPVVAAPAAFGPQSGETGPLRAQGWAVPSPDSATPSQATLFRPPGPGPFRLALIAHASTQNALRRAQMRLPDYTGLAAALVGRGYAVLVPQRPGHGLTGGPYLEDQGGCADADYDFAARATAAAIRTALAFMATQPFIRAGGAVVVGHSAGGLGALALAADDPAPIARIIAFAPGRGGHADDRPLDVCAPDRLVGAAAALGRGARVPVTWLVAENDSYFAPALSQRMADAFRAAGGKVDFRVLPPSGEEGHWLAQRDEGEVAAIIAGALAPAPARVPKASR